MPLGKRLGPKPRYIPVQNVSVGDLISVEYELAGVTYSTASYVGEIREGREVEVIAANQRVRLAVYSGNVIRHPHKDAQVILLRAAPNTGVELFQ